MAELVLTVVFAVLIVNLVLAVVICARHASAESWLLVILLAGTTGAAAAAVLAVLADNPRFLDIAVVLTGTAALTAAVRFAVRRRGSSSAAHPISSPHPTDQQAGKRS